MGGMFGGGMSGGKWGMNGGGGPGGRCRGIMPGRAPRSPPAGGGLMEGPPGASDGAFSGTILSFCGSSTEVPGTDTR